MRSRFAWKIRLLALIILLAAAGLLVRLYELQVMRGADYRQKAEAQYVKQSPNQLDRGSIFFTAKDGSLISAATQASGYTIAINPSVMGDPSAAYQALKPFLPDLEESVFFEKAGKADDTYEEIARKVGVEDGKAISALKIPGVEALRETWRFYPGGNLASQAVGFLGYGEGGTMLSGQYGLERFYDEALSKSSNGLYVNFFADLFTNIRSELSGESGGGAHLVTSIEPTVEQHLQGVLQKYNSIWHPKTSGAIVLNPKTGEIIAIAAYPSFDPNNLKEGTLDTFGNPMVERVYEFGSTMKPLTMAAGIDAGVVTPATTYNDKGSATFDKSTIYNYDKKARGVVSMQEVLNQSLNTGMAFVVSKMGTARFRDYFEKYGLTEETGVDLPGEESPLIENLKSPRTIEYVTASFGQGIAVTPISMARSLATLANHGIVPSPHVGTKLDYGGGLTKEIGWSPERRAISEQSADTITRMLVTVVDDALKDGTVKIPEYSVAAKTGTAQMADSQTKGYYTDRYLHSFFGYFPAYDAKFLIFLYAVEPQGAKYASETWTDPFIDMVKFLINYYNIPPDRSDTAAL